MKASVYEATVGSGCKVFRLEDRVRRLLVELFTPGLRRTE